MVLATYLDGCLVYSAMPKTFWEEVTMYSRAAPRQRRIDSLAIFAANRRASSIVSTLARSRNRA